MKPLKIEEKTAMPAVNLALDTIQIGKQALVFVSTRPAAEKTAEEVAERIKSNSPELGKIADESLKALSKPTKQCERLAKCLRKGIAFHHSGLTHKQRDLVEQNFRNGAVKIICCTPTLAAGIDMPAFRTIIRDLKRYGSNGMDWIPVLEYLQMCGRAGRPRFDTEGQAIAVAASENEKRVVSEKFLNGEPEEISSKLAVEPVLRTYLLSLIASGLVSSKEQIMKFFSKTFWALQFEDMDALEMIIDRMLALLEGWRFIKSPDFQDASETDRIYATAIGKRVAELYLDPLTAHHLVKCLERAQDASLSAFSFLHMVSDTLEMRPLLSLRNKDYDTVHEFLVKNFESLLRPEPSMYDPEYDFFLDSVKTAMFFQHWVDEKDEAYLLDSFSIRPGEIRSKIETSNWLLYSATELARILQMKPLQSELIKVRLRVRYGVKEELLPLLRLKGIGRVRARRLYNNRIRDLGDVKKSDLSTLSYILGAKVAQDVKEQVGQESLLRNLDQKQLSLGEHGDEYE